MPVSLARNRVAFYWNQTRQFARRVESGNERLWKVWWLGGIPVGWTTSLLVVVAEHLRYADPSHSDWGDLLDVMRFLIYFVWLRFAWRCSHNVDLPLWTTLARATLGAGLVFMAVV